MEDKIIARFIKCGFKDLGESETLVYTTNDIHTMYKIHRLEYPINFSKWDVKTSAKVYIEEGEVTLHVPKLYVYEDGSNEIVYISDTVPLSYTVTDIRDLLSFFHIFGI